MVNSTTNPLSQCSWISTQDKSKCFIPRPLSVPQMSPMYLEGRERHFIVRKHFSSFFQCVVKCVFVFDILRKTRLIPEMWHHSGKAVKFPRGKYQLSTEGSPRQYERCQSSPVHMWTSLCPLSFRDYVCVCVRALHASECKCKQCW